MHPLHKIKHLLLATLLVLSTLLTTAAGALTPVHADEPIKIGVLQFIQHDAFDAVSRGIKETLEQSEFKDRIKIDYQNANGNQNDLQSMGEKLNRDNDIVIAIGTPTAIAMAGIEKKKPIFFATVSAPVEAGLVESFEQPGGNVTGVCNMGPIAEQVDLLVNNWPDVKTVGMLYNSGELNSQAQVAIAHEEFKKHGIEVKEGTITSTNDIQQVLEPLVKQVDAMFMITDSTVDSAITLVGDIIKEAKLPMIGSSEETVKKNGLATISNSYFDFGVQTADMVLRSIKDGVEPKDMPVELGKNIHLVVNEDFAKAIGIDPTQIKEEKGN